MLALVFLSDLVILEHPNSDLAENWKHINLESLHEVNVVESEHLLDQIPHMDSDHPNLIVLNETSWSLIEPILAESSTEAALELVNVGFVEVKHLLLVVLVDQS